MKKIYSLMTIVVILVSFSITNTMQKSSQTNKLDKTDQISSKINLNSYKQSSNLTIVGNQDFSNQARKNGWPGTGTQKNPFIIENLLFNFSNQGLLSNPPLNPMLSITNVSSYFTVRNNFFISQRSNFNIAININNCKNGLFLNDTIDNFFYGIQIFNSTNIGIQNNFFKFLRFSLSIRQSNDIITQENSFLGNSSLMSSFLDYSESNNSKIIDNTFKGYQMFLEYDINLVIMNNTFDPSAISIFFSKVLIDYNIFKNSNLSSAINIDFNFGFFNFPSFFQKTYGSIIEHNLFENNSIGIEVFHEQSNFVFLNGGYINSSYSCPGFLECSELPLNYNGSITFHYSDYIIRYNEFVSNKLGAIYIHDHTDNNTIYGNDFINNNQLRTNNLNSIKQSTTQVYESPVQNVSNSWSYDGIGNYWSDYNYQRNGNSQVGQVPMSIPANDSDPFPLVHSQYNSYILPSAQNNQFDFINFIRQETIPVIVTGSIVFVLLILSVVFVENKKYKKNMIVKNNKHQTFKEYLKNKYLNRKYHERQIVTDKTFEKIEEIIDENKET